MSTINKIINLLEQQKKSQKDLTDYLKLEKSVFSAWKSGKSKSFLKYLPLIAEFLNTTVDYLINDSEETPDEDLIIINRAAKNMTPENRKKLIEMARMFFEEDFNE